MVAGSGAHRLELMLRHILGFNPVTQSKNFDKNGEFIKKFIPELKDLDASVIHEPPANVRDHLNYPQPILDLKKSRLRAIEAFKNAKDLV